MVLWYLNANLTPALIDCGLAKHVPADAVAHQTSTGGSFGTSWRISTISRSFFVAIFGGSAPSSRRSTAYCRQLLLRRRRVDHLGTKSAWVVDWLYM